MRHLQQVDRRHARGCYVTAMGRLPVAQADELWASLISAQVLAMAPDGGICQLSPLEGLRWSRGQQWHMIPLGTSM